MGKSQTTLNLETEIAATISKIENLKSIKSELINLNIHPTPNKPNIDDLHIKGDKYEQMKLEEETAITLVGISFSAKRTQMLGEIDHNLIDLELSLGWLNGQLLISQVNDQLMQGVSE